MCAGQGGVMAASAGSNVRGRWFSTASAQCACPVLIIANLSPAPLFAPTPDSTMQRQGRATHYGGMGDPWWVGGGAAELPDATPAGYALHATTTSTLPRALRSVLNDTHIPCECLRAAAAACVSQIPLTGAFTTAVSRTCAHPTPPACTTCETRTALACRLASRQARKPPTPTTCMNLCLACAGCKYGYLDPTVNKGFDVAALADAVGDYTGSCGRCYEIGCAPMHLKVGPLRHAA